MQPPSKFAKQGLMKFPPYGEVGPSRTQSIFKSDGSEKLTPADPNMDLGRLGTTQWVIVERMDALVELRVEHPEWKQPTVKVLEMARALGGLLMICVKVWRAREQIWRRHNRPLGTLPPKEARGSHLRRTSKPDRRR